MLGIVIVTVALVLIVGAAMEALAERYQKDPTMLKWSLIGVFGIGVLIWLVAVGLIWEYTYG